MMRRPISDSSLKGCFEGLLKDCVI